MDYSQLQAMDIIFKSYFALDAQTGLPISSSYTLVADGIGGIQWQSPIESLSTYGGATGVSSLANLPSYMTSTTTAVQTLSTYTISTLNQLVENYGLFSTQVTKDELDSTVRTLGSVGYVSTAGLYWLSTGLYGLQSTVSTLVVNTSSLLSLSTNLAYLFSTTLSTYTGGYLVPALGNLGNPPNGNPGNGYVSSFTLNSTVAGMSNLYITPSQLTSTTTTLGAVGYISSTQLASTIYTLGSLGYVSSSQLTSTFQSLSSLVNSRVTIENTLGNVTVYQSQVTFTSPTVISYLSTLYLSSIPYTGSLGSNGVTYSGSNIQFSSLILPLTPFTPYMASTARVFLDFTPHFVFTKLSPNITTIRTLTISTFLQQGASLLPGVAHVARFTPRNTVIQTQGVAGTIDAVNVFETPMRLTLSTGQLLANSNTPIALYHTLLGGYSVAGINPNGLHNSTVVISQAATDCVFLTVHNPPY